MDPQQTPTRRPTTWPDVALIAVVAVFALAALWIIFR
jgi:hypothetical protein